jgi:hypothetical protein
LFNTKILFFLCIFTGSLLKEGSFGWKLNFIHPAHCRHSLSSLGGEIARRGLLLLENLKIKTTRNTFLAAEFASFNFNT